MVLLREPARPAVVREHRMAPWLAVATVCFGAFMGQLDASVVTLAFPALQRHSACLWRGCSGCRWPTWWRWWRCWCRWAAGRTGMAASWCTCTGLCCSPRHRRHAGWHRPCPGWLRCESSSGRRGDVAGQQRRAGGYQRPGRAAAGGTGNSGGRTGAGPGAGPGGWRAAGRLGRLALDFLHQCSGRGGGRGGGLVLAAAHPPSPRPPGRRSAGADTAGCGRRRHAGRGVGDIRARPVAAGVRRVRRVALLAGAGLVRWEPRATAPLVDVPMLAASGIWPLLAGALCAYLVLFGPLVLIPQVLTARGGSVCAPGCCCPRCPPGSGWPRWSARRSFPPAGRTGAAAWPADCSPAAAPLRWLSPPRIW